MPSMSERVTCGRFEPSGSSGERRGPTIGDVEPRAEDLLSDRAALAPVIQLSSAARPDAKRDADVLRRRYGDRWPDLPTNLGRVGVTLERLLAWGPTAVDAEQTWTDDDAANAWLVVQAAAAHAAEIIEEGDVLGEALGARLDGLPLRQLDLLVEALVSLSAVGGGASRWADPAAASASRLVLDTYGDDVRLAADLHRQVYERFTEGVWEVRESRLRSGKRRWGLVGHALLRSELNAVSRTGKLSGTIGDASDLILRARAARNHLADLAPLLERHLGRYHRGPLTNLEPAIVSLDAVIRLQHTIVDRLDVDRLAGLLMADAFATDVVMTPALRLRDALGSWQSEVEQLCVEGDPWVLPAHQLRAWAAETRAALVPMIAALCDLTERNHPPASLRDLVDALVLREHGDQSQRTTPAPATPATPADRPENASVS